MGMGVQKDSLSGAGGFFDPQPQSSQVRFMRTLLVSADLTADEISATGGHRRFVPAPGDDPLDPKLRKIIDAEYKRGSRCCKEIITLYQPCRFRARRPLAARQGAKHPVKIGKMAEEKVRTSLAYRSKLALTAFPLCHFPYFHCARKLSFTLRCFARSNCIIRNSQHPQSSRPERRKMRSVVERSEQISAIP